MRCPVHANVQDFHYINAVIGKAIEDHVTFMPSSEEFRIDFHCRETALRLISKCSHRRRKITDMAISLLAGPAATGPPPDAGNVQLRFWLEPIQGHAYSPISRRRSPRNASTSNGRDGPLASPSAIKRRSSSRAASRDGASEKTCVSEKTCASSCTHSPGAFGPGDFGPGDMGCVMAPSYHCFACTAKRALRSPEAPVPANRKGSF